MTVGRTVSPKSFSTKEVAHIEIDLVFVSSHTTNCRVDLYYDIYEI